MLSIAMVFAAAIALMGIVQIVGVRRYTAWLRQAESVAAEPVELPRAAIILSLRGVDPFLGECLTRLAAQDYPHFEIHVVVDHPTDPAREIVEAWMAENEVAPVHLSFLQQRSEHAYLKTSAVRQCVMGLDAEVEAVVLADADTLVYRRWLRDMVQPLVNSDVGAVTGNRWYDPNVGGWGSLVRAVYGAVSAVLMYWMRATWGGSLSMSRPVFGSEYFAERMLATCAEDSAILDATERADLRLELQPNAMILNREQCTLSSCFNYVRRQLVWTRLFHPHWRQVVAGAAGAYVFLTVVFAFAVAAVLWQAWTVAALLIGAMVVELLVCQWSLARLFAAVSKRVESVQEQPFAKVAPSTHLRLFLGFPLALVVITWALFGATVCRRVSWRGIDYRVIPPDAIRLMGYRPYADVIDTDTQGMSVQ